MSSSTRNRILGILGMLLAAAGIILVSVLLRKDKAESGAGASDTVYGFAMGSTVSVHLYGADTDGTADEVIREVERLDEKVISWRADSSELAEWNRKASAGEEMRVSGELGTAVEKSLELSRKSGGSLDVTLRPVLEAWGIETGKPEEFRVPTEEELRAAAEHTDLAEGAEKGRQAGTGKNRQGSDSSSGEDVAAEEVIGCRSEEGDTYGLSRTREDITLDLGAVGKGYALDAVYALLQEKEGTAGGVIAVGGSILVFGDKTEVGDFKIGIRDPEGLPEDILGYITFSSGTKKQCVSTSGGYEKYIEKDGRRYHHIIDPATLYPAESGLRSVTVVCEDGLLSDGLSTACFILGEEKAKELLKEYGAEGVLIREDGSIYCTPGIEKQVVFR